MKKNNPLFQGWNFIPFLMVLCLSLAMFGTTAQTTPTQTVFARVLFQKVVPGQEQEFEKILKENIKPAHQLRKQNGKITNWRLFKVHFTGTQDEYGYVSVTYYDSWAKTEANDNWPELIKAANPKTTDIAGVIAKLQAVRTIVRDYLFYREDFVTSKTPVPFKFALMDFMKVKEGMNDPYLKAEKEDWKPVHQTLSDNGKRTGWGLWSLVMPGGTRTSYDYVTSNLFSSYEQLSSSGYEEAFKKAHPGKDMQVMFNEVAKTRDLVRSELWELIESL